MAVTLRDVAERAGVSVSAVSHVMTGNVKAGIKAETRERVRRVAREMGYHPSAVARALVRRQTDTLGVVLPSSSDSPLRSAYFGALLEGVLRAATTRGRDIMVFTAHPTWDSRECLSKLRDGRCDGLLLFYQPADSEVIPALLDARAPCALVGDWRSDPRLSCVDLENDDAARQITNHLLGLGHRRIAFLSDEMRIPYVSRRLAGYREALSAHGVEADEALTVTGLEPWNPASLIGRVEELLGRPPTLRPTALCCMGDEIAALALVAAGRCGLRTPQDLSVTGFNDDSNAVRQHPLLTTMRQPYEEMGLAAIDLVQAQIADAEAPPRKQRLPAQLVVRDSTAPPPEALIS